MKLEIDIPYYVFDQIKKENTIKNVLNKVDFAVRNGVERPHGKWLIVDDCEHFIAKCSICGRIEDSRMVKNYPFCRCGADMREGETE